MKNTSFFDENKILTQMTQKKLMDDLIEMAKRAMGISWWKDRRRRNTGAGAQA